MPGGEDPAATAPRLGLLLGFQSNLHSPEFSALPGVPNCCPQFADGSGSGLALGGIFQYPLQKGLALQFIASYSQLDADLSQTEVIGNAVQNDQVVQADVDHILEAGFDQISFEPRISFQPFDFPLGLSAGFQVNMLLSGTYAQREELVSPSTARFAEGGVVRNELSGDIDNTSSMTMAALAGLSYDLPLGEMKNEDEATNHGNLPGLGSQVPTIIRPRRCGLVVS